MADALVPPGAGWAWGQAVFDLGALVCTRREPACGRCPVSGHCAWYGAGRPDPDPVTGSAGIATPQSTFAGSDRQGRGRLVDALSRRSRPPPRTSRAPVAIPAPQATLVGSWSPTGWLASTAKSSASRSRQVAEPSSC